MKTIFKISGNLTINWDNAALRPLQTAVSGWLACETAPSFRLGHGAGQGRLPREQNLWGGPLSPSGEKGFGGVRSELSKFS